MSALKTIERAIRDGGVDLTAQALEEAREALEQQSKDASRLAWIAEHLFGMVDAETWKDAGGDDGQGHYEGLYHAESVQRDIACMRARYPREQAQERG